MKATSPRPATSRDLANLPEGTIGQIVDGELIVAPRPAIEHAAASSALGGELWGPFQRGRGGPGGWWILDEPELHLGNDVLVPDLAGYRIARVPAMPTGPFLTLGPDWVCEVLSPSTAGVDRVRKLAVYAREGVAHVWLIDPLARTLEVLARDGARWVLWGTFHADATVRAVPFEAIELELAALWIVKPDEPT